VKRKKGECQGEGVYGTAVSLLIILCSSLEIKRGAHSLKLHPFSSESKKKGERGSDIKKIEYKSEFILLVIVHIKNYKNGLPSPPSEKGII